MRSDDVGIRELHARCAITADAGDLTGWANCFTQEGRFSFPRVGDFVGRETLVKFIGDFQKTLGGIRTRHVVSNLSTTISGNEAKCISYVQYFHTRDGQTTLKLIGEYRDVLHKVDGEWLIATRDVVVD